MEWKIQRLLIHKKNISIHLQSSSLNFLKLQIIEHRGKWKGWTSVLSQWGWCKGQKFFLGWDCSRSTMVYDWQLDFTISFIFQQYFASLSRFDKKRLPLWEWRGSNVQEKSFVGSLQCTLLAFKHDLWERGNGESLLQMQGIAGQQFVMISTELTENKGTKLLINFVCAKQLTPRIKVCWPFEVGHYKSN